MKLVSRRVSGGPGGQLGAVGLNAQSGMDPERAEQQRRLVEELKSAQSILMRRKAAAAETDSSNDHKQRQDTTSPQTAQNSIRVDKQKVTRTNALWTKKSRSEQNTASESSQVYLYAWTSKCHNVLRRLCRPRGKNCFPTQNFTEIGQLAAQLSSKNHFQDGGRPQS